MNIQRAVWVAILTGVIVFSYAARDEIRIVLARTLAGERNWFAMAPPPLKELHHLFDLGVVDANGDGRMDFYTSNHNYRQVLLIDDGSGTFHDVLTEWGLDQNRDFPGWEQSFKVPAMDKPGLYIYWLGETLTLRAFRLDNRVSLKGTLRMHSKIKVQNSEGFTIHPRTVTGPDSPIAETILEFSGKGDAQLNLSPLSRGVPTNIELAPSLPLSQVYIGNQKVSPKGHAFSPYLRDRHGLAWADYNDDGQLDVFISRGGVGGTLRELPEALRRNIRDEMLVTGGIPRFKDITTEAGIEKKDCSGRHVKWTDFNQDGRIDLFVNCQDRGKAEGGFPKQLYRQEPDGRFRDVASEVNLGLPDHELIDFVWMDADGDGDLDLLTSEDKGFFLYRNEAGHFVAEFILRPDFIRADVAGLKSEVNNYWRFDGKLMAADFDADGDLDVFSSSKKGNVLLINDGGRFRRMDPAAIGLPAQSITAVWVDYDNDGLPDLHTVPDGLYRQLKNHRFEATGLLGLPPRRYQAAIVHWYDRDNNGTRDVLMALNENPSLWKWWEKPFKSPDDAYKWTFDAYRNTASGNHWLQINVIGPDASRQAIGARVTVSTPDGSQVQEVGCNDSSFFSQGHYRLYFGLGPHAHARKIAVRWTDGHTQELTDMAADQLLTIAYKASLN